VAGEAQCSSSRTDTNLPADLPDGGVAALPATDVLVSNAVDLDPVVTPARIGPAVGSGSATAAAVVVGMLVAAIYRRGAFYPSDAFGVAVVSGVLSVLALARVRDRLSVLLTATVGGLALWWFVRSAAAHRPAAFLPLGASMLGFLAATLVVKELDEHGRARVALALVGVAAVTAALGLVGLVWQIHPLAQRAGSFWQLATPLTHPAAAAALLGIALVLALGLDLRQPVVRAALCLVVAAFIGTQSHWTLLALAVGACLVPARRWLAAAWPLAAGVLAGVVVVAGASGHLRSWLATLLLVALVAGAGVRTVPRWGLTRVPTAAAAVVLVVVLGGLAVLVLHPPGVSGPAEPPSQAQTLAWSAAAHGWRSAITDGVGPPIVEASTQPVDLYPGLTPDTYLTVLADGGVVGAVLLAGVVTTAAWGCRRRDALTSCAAGAAVTFAVAGALSPSWELPAVAILGGCVVGLSSVSSVSSVAPVALGTAGMRTAPRLGRRIAGAGAWGVAVVALVVTQTSVGFARDAGGGLAVAQSNAPPPTRTPSAPARFILTGPDASDPYMTKWHGTYYIYTNQGIGGLNVPVRTARVPGQWGPPVDALPQLPSWAIGGLTWAPDVHQVAGGWALYYSVLLRGVNPATHCIGAAYGSSPLGPFVPVDHPFVCQLDHRGSIDPRVFVDGSHLILLWKSEDNANPSVPGPDQDGDTGIYAQELSADGRQLLGQPVKILGPSQAWEATIVEAPDMVEAWGTYWLFFSGNWFTSPSYGIGVAACETPFGPCSDVSPKPFIGSNSQGFGPGEESVFEKGANVYLVYNPFRASTAPEVPHRPAVLARVGFTPEGPYLAAP
jgi:GH43 family beta-xylosidase